MRYLLPILFVIALASCEKPELEREITTQEIEEVVKPEPKAQTQTATPTAPTQTASSTAATETQAESTQATETQVETPVETPVANGYSEGHNFAWQYIAGDIINNGDVLAIAPDGQGFDTNEHGARMVQHFRDEFDFAQIHQVIDTRGAGTDAEFSLRYANELESSLTKIHFTATDNMYLGDDLKLSIDTMAEQGNTLNISSLENSFGYVENDIFYIYNDDAPEVDNLHGAEDYYIAETGVGLEFTVFVGGLKTQSWDGRLSASVAENHLELFADDMIYVETVVGDSSMGTGRLAGIAAELAESGLSPEDIKTALFDMTVEREAIFLGNGGVEIVRTVNVILL